MAAGLICGSLLKPSIIIRLTVVACMQAIVAACRYYFRRLNETKRRYIDSTKMSQLRSISASVFVMHENRQSFLAAEPIISNLQNR